MVKALIAFFGLVFIAVWLIEVGWERRSKPGEHDGPEGDH